MAGEKTEKASPKRKQDERKKGNVFQSKDVVAAASIIAMFFIIKILAPFLMTYMQELMKKYIALPNINNTGDIASMKLIAADAIKYVMVLSMPVALVSVIVSIVATGAQTKFLFTAEKIKPKFDKMNPLKGIKNMFSMRSIVELIKNLLKVITIGIVVYKGISSEFNYIPKTMGLSLMQSMAFIGNAVWKIVVNIIVVFVFISAADFGYQWWDYEKNLRMSKQEVKEEYKQMEGNPEIKGKIKEKQRAMAMNRMMQKVPEADVVIKNPTHFAVAVKYDSEKNAAPVVLAKGQDRVALKIIEIAEENKIITVENVPLARALYAKVELDREIPPEFYQPVAEVLAYVYNLNKKDL